MCRRDIHVCGERRISAVEVECIPWKANLCPERWIYVVAGDVVPWEAIMCQGLYAVGDNFLPQKVDVCHERRFARHERRIWCPRRLCVIGGNCLPWETNLCCERRVCAVEGDYVQ